MNKSLLLLLMICAIPPAHATQFPCQNPKGKATVSNILHAKRSTFAGVTSVTVGIPRTLEGRTYAYSVFVIGTPEKSYVSIAPQVVKWAATADFKQTSLPVYFEARYGLDTKCQTTTRLKIQ